MPYIITHAHILFPLTTVLRARFHFSRCVTRQSLTNVHISPGAIHGLYIHETCEQRSLCPRTGRSSGGCGGEMFGTTGRFHSDSATRPDIYLWKQIPRWQENRLLVLEEGGRGEGRGFHGGFDSNRSLYFHSNNWKHSLNLFRGLALRYCVWAK